MRWRIALILSVLLLVIPAAVCLESTDSKPSGPGPYRVGTLYFWGDTAEDGRTIRGAWRGRVTNKSKEATTLRVTLIGRDNRHNETVYLQLPGVEVAHGEALTQEAVFELETELWRAVYIVEETVEPNPPADAMETGAGQ